MSDLTELVKKVAKLNRLSALVDHKECSLEITPKANGSMDLVLVYDLHHNNGHIGDMTVDEDGTPTGNLVEKLDNEIGARSMAVEAAIDFKQKELDRLAAGLKQLTDHS